MKEEVKEGGKGWRQKAGVKEIKKRWVEMEKQGKEESRKEGRRNEIVRQERRSEEGKKGESKGKEWKENKD